MSFGSKYSKNVGKFDFKMPETAPYKKPMEMVNTYGVDSVYKILAMAISKKGKFGPSGLVGCQCPDGAIVWVNAPAHLTPDIQAMLGDTEVYSAVNAEKAGFKFYDYEMNGITHFSMSWLDL